MRSVDPLVTKGCMSNETITPLPFSCLDHAVVYEALRLAPRQDLTDTTPWPDRPVVYALVYLGDHPAYRRAAARWPLYIGASAMLADALAAHCARLSSVPGLAPGTFSVVAVPTEADPDQVAACAIEVIDPIWNRNWLYGFDCASAGTGRSTPWDILHGPVDRGTARPDRCALLRQVDRHLSHTAPPATAPWLHI